MLEDNSARCRIRVNDETHACAFDGSGPANSDSWSEGHGFVGDSLFRGDEIGQYLRGQQLSSRKDFRDYVGEVNGHYFVILADRPAGKIYAAADRVRSIPLFYAVLENTFYISDDPYWIEQQADQDLRLSCDAAKEFLLAGYVTGPETLLPPIKQLQAGEYLTGIWSEGSWEVECKRYYRFSHEATDADRAELTEQLDCAVDAAIERLLSYAGGRPLALPLSGVYDSRLLALKLAEKGHADQVIAFSYGVPGNSESTQSRYIASQLGMRWKFVPYSNSKWSQWYNSRVFQTFLSCSENLCAYPYITIFPALWRLRERNALPESALLIPGHTLDFVSGGHIPSCLVSDSAVSAGKLKRHIGRKHYNKWDPHFVDTKVPGTPARDLMLKRMGKILDDENAKNSLTPSDACDLFEFWDWQERQAKAIVNTARIYEFWNFDWHLPYWDNRVMDFWTKVPVSMRCNRKLCKEYVCSIQQRVIGEEMSERPNTDKGFRGFLRQVPYAKPIYHLLRTGIKERLNRSAFGRILKERNRRDHPLALYGVVDDQAFARTWRYAAHPHSYWILDRITEIIDRYRW